MRLRLRFPGEICETGPERTVALEGNAQFLGSRVFATPGGSERILLLLDERDDRLAAVIYETGRRFDSGARAARTQLRKGRHPGSFGA